MEQVLLAAGADKEAKGQHDATALHAASQKGRLAAGADKEAKVQGGPNALFIASEKGHLAVVQARAPTRRPGCRTAAPRTESPARKGIWRWRAALLGA